MLNKKDFFSTYEPSEGDKAFHALISGCYYKKDTDCLERLIKVAGRKESKPYFGLIKTMFFKNFSNQEKGFEFLSEFQKDLNTSDIQKVINNSSTQEWLKENFDEIKEEVKKLTLEKPNVLCKLKDHKEFVEDQLQDISKRSERFGLNFSKHPCGVDTYLYLKDLKKEKSRLEKGSYYSDYKYERLQKKAALRVYKSIKRKAPLEFWKSVFKANKYTQERVLRNAFYRREYDKIAFLKEKDFTKLNSESMMYVAKSYLYKDEHKKLDALVKKLNFEKSEWSEEILLSYAISQIRRDMFSEAKVTLEKLLKYYVNLRLSGLYWAWVINNKLGVEIENREIVRQIEKQYGFTYYGLRIMSAEKGPDHLKKFLKTKHISVKKFSLNDEEVKKFLMYYSGDFKELFSLYLNSVKDKMTPKELALFAILLERFDSRLHAIKILEMAWEADDSLRVQPFFSISYPYPFEDKVKKAVKKLRHVNEPSVLSIARQESAFNPRAMSGSGARGLMQVISLTGKEMARVLRLRSYRGSRSLFDPSINLKIGAKYLDRLLVSSKGYLPYALASYNAGPGNMYRWSSLRPGVQDLRKGSIHKDYTPMDELWVEELPWSETRFYVKAVLRNLGLYRLLLDQRGSFSCDFYWMCGQDGKKL